MENKMDFNGEWSAEYDDAAQKIIPAYHAIYELTHHIFRSMLNGEARILVAGSGTGKEIIECAQNNPNWSFCGFDPAEPMISMAREKVSAASLESNISLLLGFVDDVAEKDFDAATAILVMHFLPDDGAKLNFLKSIADRMQPGAPFVLVDLEGEIGSDEYDVLNAAWKDQQRFSRDDAERVDTEFTVRENQVHFVSSERIELLLRQAGFTRIHKFYKAYLFGGYVAVKKQQEDRFGRRKNRRF